MSLQLAAQHLASKGRGKDTQLVHMTKGELAGLHALAKAQGASLTTNPHTGLPEAGILSSLLPMLAGAALTVMTGGAAAGGLSPLMSAGIVGGGTGLATGNLKKGILAGLGAFGGAGLAQGAVSAGVAEASMPGAAPVSATAPTSFPTDAAAYQGMEATGTQYGAMGNVAGEAPSTVQTFTPEGFTAAEPSWTPTAEVAPTTATPEATQVVAQPEVATPQAAVEPTTTAAPQAATPAAQTVTQAPQTTPAAEQAPYGTESAKEAAAQTAKSGTASQQFSQAGRGISGLMDNASTREAFMKGVEGGSGLMKYGYASAIPVAAAYTEEHKQKTPPPDTEQYKYAYSANRNLYPQSGYGGAYTGERAWFDPRFRRVYAEGGAVEQMSDRNRAEVFLANGGQRFDEGGSTSASAPTASESALSYLMGNSSSSSAAQPAQSTSSDAAYAYLMGNRPVSTQIASAQQYLDSGPSSGSRSGFEQMDQYTFNPSTGGFRRIYTGVTPPPPAPLPDAAKNGGLMALAAGGQSHLGDYSDGGRLLRGPGDGVSDSIPATIADKRPARLADGEFVVPARIVSELGNGSTDAGARKLYAMMDRIQKARNKTTGKNRVAVDSKAERMLPV